MTRGHFEGIGVDGQQVRVLVVDDDALVRRAVRLTCESEGYTVQEAERASEALARLEIFHPDVVVLDLVLPDLSGFDVCREIRRAGPPDAGDHPQRQARRDRRRARPGDRSRRLHRQAVPAPRAAGSDRRASAPGQGVARRGQARRRAPGVPRPGHRHRGAPGDPFRRGHRPHPHRVRSPLLPGVERRARCSPASGSSARSGATSTRSRRGSSTSTSATSGARSSPTRRNRATSSPCPGIGYRFAGLRR